MRKVAVFVLVLIVIFSVSSCNVKQENISSNTVSTEAEDNNVQAGDNRVSTTEEHFSLYELAYAFIGAFFGFSFTLVLDRSYKALSERRKNKMMLANAQAELNDIRKLLDECDFKEKRAKFEMPSYRSMIHSGLLLQYYKKNYCECMMSSYIQCERYLSKLKEIEERERLFEFFYFSTENSNDEFVQVSDKLKAIGNEELKEIKNEVINKINEFQNAISK